MTESMVPSSNHLALDFTVETRHACDERIEISILRAALEASWDYRTAYQGVQCAGNPALGQCYPTSRVVQWFLPEFEIARGQVWTGEIAEAHFWNVRRGAAGLEHLDLSWSQFPIGSQVTRFELLDRRNFGDGPSTIARVELLLQRVLLELAAR
jgi:hypothetical protein